MNPTQVARNGKHAPRRAQGHNRTTHKTRGNSPQLTRAINRIEAQAAMPFERWLRRVASSPVCAVVHRESADCFVIKLVDITGSLFLEEIPMKRTLYDALHAAVTARGVPLHQFILEAVEAECARQEGGAR
jgi:hypothetical protein